MGGHDAMPRIRLVVLMATAAAGVSAATTRQVEASGEPQTHPGGLMLAGPDQRSASADGGSASMGSDLLLDAGGARAQPEAPEPNEGLGAPAAPADDSANLAKKLSNPIADLISVPAQFNYDTGFGPSDAERFNLNIQPVIPFHLDEQWNLVTRTIMPLIYQDSPAPGLDDSAGLGDVVQSFFLSPRDPVGGWIIGVGPVFSWPTATENSLGSRKWGAGPTAVALRQEGGWTYGALANHIWSFAGESDRAQINTTFVQPFVSYTFPSATSISLNSESSYDWTNDEATIPLNLMCSQVLKVGGQPISLQLGGRYYADTPDGGPEWGLRFGITFLFPR